jgi:hypothetical protein
MEETREEKLKRWLEEKKANGGKSTVKRRPAPGIPFSLFFSFFSY